MARKRRDVPWLEQRDNGVWYAYKYDAAQRRTLRESLETKDSTEAQLRFARLLTEGFRSTRLVGDAGLTVWQALDQYVEEHVKEKVVAKDRQLTAIKRLKSYFKPDDLISDVDVHVSRAYREARLNDVVGGEKGRGNRKCRSDSTVRRELVVLTAAANHAAWMKRIGPNAKPMTPMPTIELPTETRSQNAKWLSKSDVTRIFAQAEIAVQAAETDEAQLRALRLQGFIKIAYFTAARRHSIERLTRKQIDLAHGIIYLDPAGAEETNKRRPPVPLYAEIRPIVERLLMTSKCEYLFGGIPDFYRPFAELCARLGIEAYPHMMRHSRATHMLMDGEDIYKVSRLLGDTVQTVLKTYAHATVEYLQTKSTVTA